MRKTALYMIAALLLGLCAIAFAQEFPDVPPDHWAYDAVQELVDAGIIQGYPDGTFGGKRAMTRYEFAEAMAKAIPVIAEMAGGGGGTGQPGGVGPQGPPGPQGPAGPPGTGANQEQISAMQRMMDEFQDELASLGVQVESVRRDLNALTERVGILEDEVNRVKWNGDVNLMPRGVVVNDPVAGTGIVDRDGRFLEAAGIGDSPLASSEFFTDFQLGVTGRVSDDASLEALIAAGNYLPFALDDEDVVDDFTLWRLNLDAAMQLGPLGQGQITVGRFPFQLTPLTLKFVDPDSYVYVDKLDSGDFVFDGGSIMFNWGKIALTAFAAKTNPIGGLMVPALLTNDNDDIITQMAGARFVIGTGFLGNLGLTYYQAGIDPDELDGHVDVWGADINTSFGAIGLMAEYAQTEPNDNIQDDLTGVADAGQDNSAWNAKLNFTLGNLGIGAGYQVVEHNYVAPGYWDRLGALVNPVNVKGYSADLAYSLTSNIQLTAKGSFLEPDSIDAGLEVGGRTGIDTDRVVDFAAADVDEIEYWNVGLKYQLTSANSVDLGYEEFTVSPTATAGPTDTEERFINIGLGHTFNPNASMKLLYQIVEYEGGSLDIAGGNFRGGVASAQFAVKF